MVHPDKRKGQVYIYQSDDSLMHFCWKDRSKGNVEDDFIIFPDDVEFKHVTQCTTGRVYLLKFKSTSRKMFFWMQEPKTEKDDEHMRKVNDFLNNPPTPGSSRGGGGGGSSMLPPELTAGLTGGDSDLQSMLGNMSQQQLMQLLGGMGMGGLGGLPSAALMGGRPSSAQSDSAPPSRVQSSPGPRGGSSSSSSSTPAAPRPVTAAALPSQTTTSTATPTTTSQTATSPTTAGTTTSSSSARPTIQLSDLQNILSGLGGEAGGAEGGEAIDLTTAVTPEAMLPILANADVQAKLIPHLPEGESLPKTEAELRNTITTPQFQQALQSFSAALASGQLGPLMTQFDLGEDAAAAAASGDVEGFVKAMQAREAKKKVDDEKKE